MKIAKYLILTLLLISFASLVSAETYTFTNQPGKFLVVPNIEADVNSIDLINDYPIEKLFIFDSDSQQFKFMMRLEDGNIFGENILIKKHTPFLVNNETQKAITFAFVDNSVESNTIELKSGWNLVTSYKKGISGITDLSKVKKIMPVPENFEDWPNQELSILQNNFTYLKSYFVEASEDTVVTLGEINTDIENTTYTLSEDNFAGITYTSNNTITAKEFLEQYTLKSIFIFNVETQQFEFIMELKDGEIFGENFNIKKGDALLVKSKVNQSIIIENNIENSPTTLDLKAGWNFVSYPSNSHTNIVGIKDTEKIANIIPVDNEFDSSDIEKTIFINKFTPNGTYFIRALEDTTVTITSTPEVVPVELEEAPDTKVGTTITHDVSEGASDNATYILVNKENIEGELSIDDDGIISFTPKEAGTYEIVVKILDGDKETIKSVEVKVEEKTTSSGGSSGGSGSRGGGGGGSTIVTTTDTTPVVDANTTATETETDPTDKEIAEIEDAIKDISDTNDVTIITDENTTTTLTYRPTFEEIADVNTLIETMILAEISDSKEIREVKSTQISKLRVDDSIEFEFTKTVTDENSVKLSIETHTITINHVDVNSVTLTVQSDPIVLTIENGKAKGADIDSDGNDDVLIKVLDIENKEVKLEVLTIKTQDRTTITEDTNTTDTNVTAVDTNEIALPAAGVGFLGLTSESSAILVLVIIVLVLIGIYYFHFKEDDEEDDFFAEPKKEEPKFEDTKEEKDKILESTKIKLDEIIKKNEEEVNAGLAVPSAEELAEQKKPKKRGRKKKAE